MVEQKDRTITNIYTPNDRLAKYESKKDRTEERYSSTIIVEDCNTYSVMVRTAKQKINKEIENNKLLQTYTEYPTPPYNFFKCTWDTLQVTHMLGHK